MDFLLIVAQIVIFILTVASLVSVVWIAWQVCLERKIRRRMKLFALVARTPSDLGYERLTIHEGLQRKIKMLDGKVEYAYWIKMGDQKVGVNSKKLAEMLSLPSYEPNQKVDKQKRWTP